MPSEGNFVLMIPSPGDPATEQFQLQKDGVLFFKVKEGRGGMPSFVDVLGDDELWSLIAYMRSFNTSYEQPEFILEGVHIPTLALEISYDDNVDKLVVKAYADEVLIRDIEVSAFVKGYFGNLKLGKTLTNENGIAYFNVDKKMPGDTIGNLNFIVKAKQGYAYEKAESVLLVAIPKTKASITDGRSSQVTSQQQMHLVRFHSVTLMLCYRCWQLVS